ncbi:MAG TPA: ATP-grasp domain-containing protein [Burkholderiaceae bacterium]|nr:ATP-grasp domain-containing protein [Burkholderiaceae bacterium]
MTRIFVYEFASGSAPSHLGAELMQAGTAMRDAIVGDLLQLPCVATTCAVGSLRRAGFPPSVSGRKPAMAGPQMGEDCFAFVRRVAERHDLSWIVAPETDGTLARMHDTVGASAWIGCSGDAIRTASSKSATSAALDAFGIPTARSLTSAAKRWIVKPDDGAGTLDTRVHSTRESALTDLCQRERDGRRATLEPFVDGEPMSISMVVGGRKPGPVAFNRQRIEIDGEGLMHDVGVIGGAILAQSDARVPQLQALACAVMRALPGLKGYVGLDLVWHPERGPVVMEVNPRVTCAYVGLSERLDRNIAAEIVSMHLRRKTPDAALA